MYFTNLYKMRNGTCNLYALIAAVLYSLHVPYPRERGPMDSAPYTGPRSGDGARKPSIESSKKLLI